MIKVRIIVDGNLQEFVIADKNVEKFKNKFKDLTDILEEDWNYDKLCEFIADEFVCILEHEIDNGDYGLFNYLEL